MDILVTFLMTKKISAKFLQNPQVLWEIRSWEANLTLSENWFVNRNSMYLCYLYLVEEKKYFDAFDVGHSDKKWLKLLLTKLLISCK